LNTPIINDFKSYETKIFSVSEINKLVKDMLQHNFPIILVKGEISNFIEATSGHWYFSLKDSNAQVRCTMFKGKNSRIKWKPKNGESIEAECKVGLYEARGEYQLNVESLQKSGLGDLFEEFNRLKEKLIAEGLFDEVNKKPIPSFVKRVGVVTSPDGAVVRDIISTLKRRNEFLKIVIYPTPVQGNGSVEGIVNALNTANQRDEVDVVILARGGGSIEDLWSFNDENVARCISQSILPTISAIGHETDVTISDFIADLRAPTPTAAAEIVSINLSDIFEKLEYFNLKLLTIIQSKIDYLYQKIDYLEKRLMSPSEKIIAQNVLIKNYLDRITISMKSSLNNYQNKIDLVKKNISLLNPNEILSRGYSIIFDKNQIIVNDVSQILVKDKIEVKLHKGRLKADIMGIKEKDGS
jgi:exodeoxyribonuclease VII large subunit